jgi:hypothetical protein
MHFCRGEDDELEEGLSISAKNSPVRFFKVVVPFMLFRSKFRSDIEKTILAEAPEAYRYVEFPAVRTFGMRSLFGREFTSVRTAFTRSSDEALHIANILLY